MPVSPAPLPDGLGTSFARRRALAAGVSPARLRAKDLDIPFRGVRTVSSNAVQGSTDETPFAIDRAIRHRVFRLARAYAHVMPREAFFACRTAAVLLGAPVGHGESLDVGVLDPARAPRRHGIRGVKVAPHLVSVEEHGGLRMSSPTTMWAMLARQLNVRELVIVGDWLVRVPRDHTGTPRPDRALATLEELQEMTMQPRRGVSKLRDASALIRVGSASPLETEFRLDAAAAGLPDPELDVEIFDQSGRRIGITEFVYPRQRTLVEIEGDHHRTDRAQWNRDIEKYAAYVASGWEVVRLTSAHVRGPHAGGVAMVREVLRRRGWQDA